MCTCDFTAVFDDLEVPCTSFKEELNLIKFIVFLKCSNNRAETILQGFVIAALAYGLPQKMCTRGNVDAWKERCDFRKLSAQ